jgi:hypothetical protein
MAERYVDRRSSSGAMHEAVGKWPPSATGVKPVESPIRPVPIIITVIIWLVGIARCDAAIARLVEITRRAGGGGRLGR